MHRRHGAWCWLVPAVLASAGCPSGDLAGACARCVDGGSSEDAAPRGDASMDRPDGGVPLGDGGDPDARPPELDASAPPDAGGPSFAWVWIDRGGPAYQPHACAAGAGVVDGMLVDPMAFFAGLVAGRDPNTWATVMNDVESELWSCGLGQQRDSGGAARGRLFLPSASCPDASPPPDDATAMHLGVRQEPDCWTHAVDVVEEL